MENALLTAVDDLAGILAAFPVEPETRHALYDIEVAAEKKAFMGMGKVYNSGIREVLACPDVILAVTGPDFDWGCHSHMLLMKDDEVVGEEVWEAGRLRELEKRPDVYFIHRNFVIYTAKVNFPRDITEKICHFEYPAIPVGGEIPGLPGAKEAIMCHPSTAGDLFLKQNYFGGRDERGTGTAVFGFRDAP